VPLINLILAGFWLVLGVVLLAPVWLWPDQPVLMIPGIEIPVGWLAVVLAGYNVLRWWLQRSHLRRQREWEDNFQRLRRRAARPGDTQESQTPVERDPNFIFSDDPPNPEGK
jgi:hypothetical protein